MHIIAKVIATTDYNILTYMSIDTCLCTCGYIIHTHTREFIHLCTCMQVYLKNTFCSSEEEFLWEHLKNTFLQKNFHHHDTVTFPNWNIFLMLKEILNAWWWKWTQCLEVILIKLSYANFNNYPTCYIKKILLSVVSVSTKDGFKVISVSLF